MVSEHCKKKKSEHFKNERWKSVKDPFCKKKEM